MILRFYENKRSYLEESLLMSKNKSYLSPKVLELHNEGKTVAEICSLLSCHNNTIYKILYCHNISPNTKKKFLSDIDLTEDLIKNIHQMRESKKTRKEISLFLNISEPSLNRLLKILNIKTRKCSRYNLSVGQKINNLQIIDFVYIDKIKHCKCMCLCGKETIKLATSVANGNTKSCGCLHIESSRNNGKNSVPKRTKYTPEMSSAIQNWRGRYKECPLETYLLLSKQPCHYCGSEPNRDSNRFKTYIGQGKYNDERIAKANWISNGLDRIDSSKAHTAENVVPCCWTCNRAKSNMSYEMFLEWISGLVAFRSKK